MDTVLKNVRLTSKSGVGRDLFFKRFVLIAARCTWSSSEICKDTAGFVDLRSKQHEILREERIKMKKAHQKKRLANTQKKFSCTIRV